VEDREAHRLALVAERARHLVQITETERRLAQIDQRYRISSEAFQKQLASIAGQMNKADETVAALQNEIVEVEKAIVDDRYRAKEYTAREIEAAIHQLDALFAESKSTCPSRRSRRHFRARSSTGIRRRAWPGTTFRCLRSPPAAASSPGYGCLGTR
jgi:hypothetical protein